MGNQAVDQDLGVRTRFQRLFGELELQAEEFPLAENPIDRLVRRAALDRGTNARGILVADGFPSARQERGKRKVEQAGDQVPCIEPRRFEAGALSLSRLSARRLSRVWAIETQFCLSPSSASWLA